MFFSVMSQVDFFFSLWASVRVFFFCISNEMCFFFSKTLWVWVGGVTSVASENFLPVVTGVVN